MRMALSDAALRGMLMMTRIGVLVLVFARRRDAVADSSCSDESGSAAAEHPSSLYSMLALHMGLAILACTCSRGVGSRLEACAAWCLLGVTAVLAGQSQDREALVLIFSELCAVICSVTTQQQTSRVGKLPFGHVLGFVRHAKETAQRSASQLSLVIARRALEALAFSCSPAAPVSFRCKAWTAEVEKAAREVLSRQASLKEMRISSFSMSSSGELFNMGVSSAQACTFELDMQCDLDGTLSVDSAPQVCFGGVTLSARAKVNMPEAAAGGESDAQISLSNFKASFKPRSGGRTIEGGNVSEAMQNKLARLIERSLASGLKQPLCLKLPASGTHQGGCEIAGSVSGCGLCLVLRVSLYGEQHQNGQADGWRVRARIVSPGLALAGAGGEAWHRGRPLDMASGPRRSALTLMVASEHDTVEMQVFKGGDASVGARGRDALLGSWVGVASTLLHVSTKSAIRVEGDVRLPLKGTGGLGLAVSGRLVKLEPGSPSDLREVPGLGLRGVVGVVAGCVEELVLSPWDCSADNGSRFFITECSVGSDASSSDAIRCARLQPHDTTDRMTAHVGGCGGESAFLLPLCHAPMGHVLRVRLLQGSEGRSDMPLRCVGQAELLLPGGESDTLIGTTRLELMDGPAQAAYCMLSFTVKRAPSYRVSKAHFADIPTTSAPPKRASGAEEQGQSSPAASKVPDRAGSGVGHSPAPAQRSPSPHPPTAAVSTGILKAANARSSSAVSAAKPKTTNVNMAAGATPTGSVHVECVRTYSDPHNGHVVSLPVCLSFCPSAPP